MSRDGEWTHRRGFGNLNGHFNKVIKGKSHHEDWQKLGGAKRVAHGRMMEDVRSRERTDAGALCGHCISAQRWSWKDMNESSGPVLSDSERHLFSFTFCCMIRHYDGHKKLQGEQVFIASTSTYGPSLRKVCHRSQGRNSRQEYGAENIAYAWWVAYMFPFWQLSYGAQVHLSRDGPTHHGLFSPILTINKANP